ncbi:VOC family protein [Candidatus Uhrbacteria bacterium]|nr:VOC family protein [Candidatus Uhrbacteria bacterium]
MLNHITITTKSLDRLQSFYDESLAPLGVKRLHEGGGYCGYGIGKPVFWISEGEQVSKVHVAFDASDVHAVEEFYRVALEAGGTDNGAPGIRAEYHEKYYAAFVLDPDGNNIEVVFGN